MVCSAFSFFLSSPKPFPLFHRLLSLQKKMGFESKLFHGHINWFPGHMAKAVGNFKALVAEADGILEVRDARVSRPAMLPDSRVRNLMSMEIYADSIHEC